MKGIEIADGVAQRLVSAARTRAACNTASTRVDRISAPGWEARHERVRARFISPKRQDLQYSLQEQTGRCFPRGHPVPPKRAPVARSPSGQHSRAPPVPSSSQAGGLRIGKLPSSAASPTRILIPVPVPCRIRNACVSEARKLAADGGCSRRGRLEWARRGRRRHAGDAGCWERLAQSRRSRTPPDGGIEDFLACEPAKRLMEGWRGPAEQCGLAGAITQIVWAHGLA